MTLRALLAAVVTCGMMVVPGVNATESSPEAKAILETAGKALTKVDTLSFTAELTPKGAAVQAVPHVKGTVTQARAKSGLKLNVQGSFEQSPDTWEKFHVVTDGKQIASINAGKKEMVAGKLPAAGALMDPAYFLVMQRMASSDPFEQEIDEALTLEKAESVGGVECHVIRVDYENKQAGTARLFIGKSDHMLRRIDRERGEGDEKGSVSLTTSDFKTNPKIPEDTFAAKLPDGYKEVKFKPAPGGRPALLEEGDAAPDWTLKTPEGKEVSLKKDLAGKVVLIDFWATWCGPCKAAMPGIQKVYEHFQKNDKVAIYGISTWERNGDPAGYMKAQKFTYGLLVQGEKAAEAYKVSGIPTFYVIGKDGKIVHAESGMSPDLEKSLIGIIEDALGE